MYKIGMIGDRETVLGFLALGYTVFEAEDAETAREILCRLAADESFAVIFLTEHLAMHLEEDLARYRTQILPAITIIPDKTGSRGVGLANIKSAVERAVGADIIFRD